MKKNLLLMAGLLPALFSQAQSITVDDTLSTLESMFYYAGDTSVTSYDSETGATANWDYSTLNMAEGITTPNLDTIIDRANSTYSADFLAADYEENFDGGVHSFFSNTPDTVFTHGFVFEESGTTYKIMYDVNPLGAIKLPTTIGTTYIDDISGNATSSDLFGQTVEVSGTANINADGTGTLTLPGGNVYLDVIRIKTVEDISGYIDPIPVVFPSGGNVYVTRTSYIYYSPSTSNMPIFIYGIIDAEFENIGTVNLKTVWSKDELVEIPVSTNGIEANSLSENISIYPNPANSILNVKSEGIDMISIYNTVGQKVYTNYAPKNNETINVSELPTGVYFIKIEKNNITTTQKLIIK